MQNPPKYAVTAADHTLRLLLFLLQRRELRVLDAAQELDVARSTAHRLLQMLVFRGFAIQRSDRWYVVGPALVNAVPMPDPLLLRAWLRPALELVHRTRGETVHLMIRDGSEVVFLDSLESTQPLRVGSREGMRLPAETASGGRALLSLLPVQELRHLYRDRRDLDLATLERGLQRVRRQGYGLNVDATEPGITAVGVAILDSRGQPVAAVALSAPTLRFRRSAAPEAAQLLRHAVDSQTHHVSALSDPRG